MSCVLQNKRDAANTASQTDLFIQMYIQLRERNLNAIEIPFHDTKIVAEIHQHIGDDEVRCVALSSTDGLSRGMEAFDTGEPIKVPVGPEVLGRLFNVLGNPID